MHDIYCVTAIQLYKLVVKRTYSQTCNYWLCGRLWLRYRIRILHSRKRGTRCLNNSNELNLIKHECTHSRFLCIGTPSLRTTFQNSQQVHRFVLFQPGHITKYVAAEIKLLCMLPMRNFKSFAYSGLISGVLFFIVRECFLNLLSRNKIPQHMLNNKIVLETNLIRPDMGKSLLDLAINIGSVKGYPTNTNDTSFYHTEHEHIGEAIPIEITSDGNVRCSNPFLIPSSDRTQCVLPGIECYEQASLK